MGERAPGSQPSPDPGSPELGYAGRVLALCAAGLVLAGFSAAAALLAWNLAAATRGERCPEPPGGNSTANPDTASPDAATPDPGPDLRRRLHELEETWGACRERENLLQTRLVTLETEVEEAKARGTRMGAENRALTEALAQWEVKAAESSRRLEEEQQRARAAETEGGACAAREAGLRERVTALEAQRDAPRRAARTRPRSGSRSRNSGGCRRPARTRR